MPEEFRSLSENRCDKVSAISVGQPSFPLMAMTMQAGTSLSLVACECSV